VRILLLLPYSYSLKESFIEGFEANGCIVSTYDYRIDTKELENRIHTHIRKFPYKIRAKWYGHYVSKINKNHLKVFQEESPDLVLDYNSEMLFPETVLEIKKTAKVIFLSKIVLDYYTQRNVYYLPTLAKAETIYFHNTAWVNSLQILGLKKRIPIYILVLLYSVNIMSLMWRW